MLANAARYLARLKFDVVAMDFDWEAPGLPYKFSLDDDGGRLQTKRGIVEYLHEFIKNKRNLQPISNYVVNVKISCVPGLDEPQFRFIPAGAGPSPEYWEKLCDIDWHRLFHSKHAKGVEFFDRLKEEIIGELDKPDFLLIDSRTGITEMGGVAATLLADTVVCVVTPTMENLEGSRAVIRSIAKFRKDMKMPIDLVVALSRFPDFKSTKHNEMLTEAENFINIISRHTVNENNDREPMPQITQENVADSLIKSIKNYIVDPVKTGNGDLEKNVGELVKDIFVLHFHEKLLAREYILIGSDEHYIADHSKLLRDYWRLFSHLVPDNSQSFIEDFAEEVFSSIKDKTNANMKFHADIFGHPVFFRHLLEYQIKTNAAKEDIWKTAQRIWELTTPNDSGHPLIWQAVQGSFSLDLYYQNAWFFDLNCVEQVWRNAGKCEWTMGMKLVDVFEKSGSYARAADVFVSALEQKSNPEPELVCDCLAFLVKVKSNTAAYDLIEQYQGHYGGNPQFLKQWAEFVLALDWKPWQNELYDSPHAELLKQSSPELADKLRISLLKNAY